MNTQRISPQGYNINENPMNVNPFWENEGTGGNVPAGGTTGQVLTKRTNADYDTEWKTPESGGGADWPAGGSVGDLLTKAVDGAAWTTPTYASAADLTALEAEVDTKADAADLTALAGRVSTAEDDIDNILTALEDLPSDERMDAAEQDILDLQNDMAVEQEINRGQNATIETISNRSTQNQTAITALQGRMTTAEGNITAQAAEDTRLAGLISAEATARADADSLIRSDLGDDIDDEATARAAADAALAGRLTTAEGDIDAAEAAITALQGRMTTAEGDIDAAEAAITTLQGAVSGINGLPAGGTAGQVLTKSTSTDYDVDWTTPGAGSGLPTLRAAGTQTDIDLVDSPTATYSGRTFLPFARYPSAGESFKKWVQITGLMGVGADPGGGLIPVMSNSGTEPVQGVSYMSTQGKAGFFMFPGTASGGDINKNHFNDAPVGSLMVKFQNPLGGVGATASYTDPVSGGTTGQVLTKSSNSDYDWEWATPSGGGSGLPSGGSAGDLLAMGSSGAEWITPSYASASSVTAVAGDLSTEVTTRAAADTALSGRLTTAEGDIDTAEAAITALQGRMTTAEADIDALEADVSALDGLTTWGAVASTTGTNPSFLALPFVSIDKDGTVNTTAAPDAWAQYYSGSTPAGAYSTDAIIFDCDTWGGSGVGSGSIVLDNTTYGTSGKIYVPVTTGVNSTACVKNFTINAENGECVAVEVAVALSCTEVPGLTVEGTVSTILHKTQYADYPAAVSGKFRVTASNVDLVRGGGPDWHCVIVNNGAGSYSCRLGFAHDFFRWLGMHWNNCYRWNVSVFGIHKMISK